MTSTKSNYVHKILIKHTLNNFMDKESTSDQWIDLVSQLFDRLTGKEALVEYSFENFTIEVPEAAGPGGRSLGSARWTINGKLIVKAEAKNSLQ